jgi:hypothetical protein
MLRRFMACTSVLTLIASAAGSMADDVGLSAAERAKNIKAYEARKAQGLTTDSARGGRGAGQQARQRAQRCQEALNDAQNTAVGASVLSHAAGFLPFGGTASGIAGAAAGVGATAAGEIARQKATAAVQGNC